MSKVQDLVLIPGSYKVGNAKGGSIGRFIMDWLVLKGILQTEDCCNYTLVGGTGGGVTTNNLVYNPITNQLTSTVNGVTSVASVVIDTADINGLLTNTLTFNPTTNEITSTVNGVVSTVDLSDLDNTSTTNVLSFDPVTNELTSNVNGVIDNVTLSFDSDDILTTLPFTISGILFPAGTSLTLILDALVHGADPINGLYRQGENIKLGGDLIENTTIDGKNDFRLVLRELSDFVVYTANNNVGHTLTTRIDFSTQGSIPTIFNSELVSDSRVRARLSLHPDNVQTFLESSTLTHTSGLSLPFGQEVKLYVQAEPSNTLLSEIRLQEDKVFINYLTQVPGDLEYRIQVIDPVTGQLFLTDYDTFSRDQRRFGNLYVTSNYTITSFDSVLEVDTTAGNVTITLPATIIEGHRVTIIKVAGTNDVIVNATPDLVTPTYTISPTYTIAQSQQPVTWFKGALRYQILSTV